MNVGHRGDTILLQSECSFEQSEEISSLNCRFFNTFAQSKSKFCSAKRAIKWQIEEDNKKKRRAERNKNARKTRDSRKQSF